MFFMWNVSACLFEVYSISKASIVGTVIEANTSKAFKSFYEKFKNCYCIFHITNTGLRNMMSVFCNYYVFSSIGNYLGTY